jgi:hypothetical protein
LAIDPAATAAAVSRALARSSTLRTSVKPNFCRPAGRVPGRGRWISSTSPPPATGSSAPPSWGSRGWRPARRSGCPASPVATARADLDRVALDLHPAAPARGRADAAPCRCRAPPGRARGPRAALRRSRPGPACDSPAVVNLRSRGAA